MAPSGFGSLSKSHDPKGPCAHLPQSPVRPTELGTTEIPLGFGLPQRRQQSRGGREPDRVAVLHDLAPPPDGHMSLPSSRRSDYHHVLTMCDEMTRAQFSD